MFRGACGCEAEALGAELDADEPGLSSSMSLLAPGDIDGASQDGACSKSKKLLKSKKQQKSKAASGSTIIEDQDPDLAQHAVFDAAFAAKMAAEKVASKLEVEVAMTQGKRVSTVVEEDEGDEELTM